MVKVAHRNFHWIQQSIGAFLVFSQCVCGIDTTPTRSFGAMFATGERKEQTLATRTVTPARSLLVLVLLPRQKRTNAAGGSVPVPPSPKHTKTNGLKCLSDFYTF